MILVVCPPLAFERLGECFAFWTMRLDEIVIARIRNYCKRPLDELAQSCPVLRRDH